MGVIMVERCDKKRGGSATMFIILGLVVLIIVGLFTYLRGENVFNTIIPGKVEQGRMGPIRDHINDCVIEVSTPLFERIALQGGTLDIGEDVSLINNGIHINYLCFGFNDGNQCQRRFITLSNIEEELADKIKESLSSCITLSPFGESVDLSAGVLDVDVRVGDYESIVTIDYPITLNRDGVIVEEDEFVSTLNVPLGKSYSIANEILNMEAMTGTFDDTLNPVLNMGKFSVQSLRPWPNEIYIIKHILHTPILINI